MGKRKIVKVITPQTKKKLLDEELNYNFMNYINAIIQVRKRQKIENRINQTMEWTLLSGMVLIIIIELIA